MCSTAADTGLTFRHFSFKIWFLKIVLYFCYFEKCCFTFRVYFFLKQYFKTSVKILYMKIQIFLISKNYYQGISNFPGLNFSSLMRIQLNSILQPGPLIILLVKNEQKI